jgi:putative endonuclease
MTLKRALENSVSKIESNAAAADKHVDSSSPAHLKLGAEGEQIATEYLSSKGFRIIGRNVRYRWGEIDIIAKDGDEIAFVEVRTRSVGLLMPADRSVGPDKLKKLVRASRTWVEEKNYNGFWRIDLVAITINNKQNPDIEYIKNITEGIS